jgi:hypothetical protein
MARIELDCPELGSLCPVSRVYLILDEFYSEFNKIIAKIILFLMLSIGSKVESLSLYNTLYINNASQVLQ